MANPDGRKPHVELTKKVLDRIRKMAAAGMYEKQIAAVFGYHPNYWCELKKKHPELAEAIKAGAAEGIETATETLMGEIKKRNLGATIFYLKCKAGWRENDHPREDGDSDGDSGTVSGRILDDVRKVRGGPGRRGSSVSPD